MDLICLLHRSRLSGVGAGGELSARKLPLPPFLPRPLELAVHGRPAVRDDVADVVHAGEVDQQALEAHAEAGMRAAAKGSYRSYTERMKYRCTRRDTRCI